MSRSSSTKTVEVGRYTVVSPRASRDIGSALDLRPYFGVNNLFDERCNSNIRANAFGGRYYEPAPGRNAYAGIDVRYRFDDL